MNILVLGGNSQRHQQWIRDLGAALDTDGNTVIIHDYKSWEDGTDTDVQYEINAIAAKIANFDTVTIVAKSIGTIITILGTASGAFNAQRCVLLGLPLTMVDTYFSGLGASIKKLPDTVFVQNESDPYGSAADIANFVKANEPSEYTFISVPDNQTHDYLDFGRIKDIVGG